MNKLGLFSKIDIPFPEARLIIHNPTVLQISYIGEESFYRGCQVLTFSKDKLNEQDKIRLQGFTNFEVLMTMIKDKSIAVAQRKISMMQVLTLLFPDYQINLLPTSILLSKKQDGSQEIERFLIDKDNFESFSNIVSQMFCLKGEEGKSSRYNPGGPQARALVAKFEQRRQKLNKLKGIKDEGISILYRYVSILAVGQKKDINQLLQYTVYQLFDEFRRFKKKEEYDLYVKAKMAGAKDLEQIQNWMG